MPTNPAQELLNTGLVGNLIAAIEVPDTTQNTGCDVETALAEFVQCDSEIQ